MPRWVLRANVVKRLTPLEGAPGRTVYGHGAVRIERADETLVVRPAFGIAHEAEYTHVHLEPLLHELARDRLVGVVLVRLGGFAVGVFEGERLLASKVGTRNVHGRHRAGGSSANRFRRRREGQARELVQAAAGHAARVLSPYSDRLDAVALGGDRFAIRDTLAARRELTELAERALPRFLTVPDPRRAVLERSIQDVYAAEVAEEDGPGGGE